eukprot:CAMPEP_0119293022 /NCGR_PEP_ID=MMETSP1329-20130426/45282_1 /TAXON_ID=114041 /ORGANISM="Genus nov. species nov., Strain RCC1024" /LENGTH=132 /DNA_ID=CAMNT_0007293879 /DNA_START=22 /DNA_END=416 /DNA_ORIENTATION=+
MTADVRFAATPSTEAAATGAVEFEAFPHHQDVDAATLAWLWEEAVEAALAPDARRRARVLRALKATDASDPKTRRREVLEALDEEEERLGLCIVASTREADPFGAVVSKGGQFLRELRAANPTCNIHLEPRR